MEFKRQQHCHGGRRSRHREIYWHRHRHRDFKIESFQICRLRRDGRRGGGGGGGGGGQHAPPPRPGGGAGPRTTLPAAASVTVNATVTLTPVITPADADKSLTWTSNDDHIASVAEGVVT